MSLNEEKPTKLNVLTLQNAGSPTDRNASKPIPHGQPDLYTVHHGHHIHSTESHENIDRHIYHLGDNSKAKKLGLYPYGLGYGYGYGLGYGYPYSYGYGYPYSYGYPYYYF